MGIRRMNVLKASKPTGCVLQPLVPPGVWHIESNPAVHSCPLDQHSKIFGLLGISQHKFRAARRLHARCRDAARAIRCTPNTSDEVENATVDAAAPTDLRVLCHQTLAELGISCDQPVAEEEEIEDFSIFLKDLKILLLHSEDGRKSMDSTIPQSVGVQDESDSDVQDESDSDVQDESDFDVAMDLEASFNDCHEFASGEMRGCLDSHVQKRSGEEVYSAKMVLSNMPFDIPAPISSLFQSLWRCPLCLPEDKIVALAGQRAEDHCLGTDVTKEMAISGAVQIWKTSRQVVIQQISSLPSWGAVTDASDVVNFVNSEDVAESKTKWRPD